MNYFKFLSKNEEVLFDLSVIDAAREYVRHFLDCYRGHFFANRQHQFRNGVFYITEFEYDSDIDTYYITMIYRLGNNTATFRYREDLMMFVNVTVN